MHAYRWTVFTDHLDDFKTLSNQIKLDSQAFHRGKNSTKESWHCVDLYKLMIVRVCYLFNFWISWTPQQFSELQTSGFFLVYLSQSQSARDQGPELKVENASYYFILKS